MSASLATTPTARPSTALPGPFVPSWFVSTPRIANEPEKSTWAPTPGNASAARMGGNDTFRITTVFVRMAVPIVPVEVSIRRSLVSTVALASSGTPVSALSEDGLLRALLKQSFRTRTVYVPADAESPGNTAPCTVPGATTPTVHVAAGGPASIALQF